MLDYFSKLRNRGLKESRDSSESCFEINLKPSANCEAMDTSTSLKAGYSPLLGHNFVTEDCHDYLRSQHRSLLKFSDERHVTLRWSSKSVKCNREKKPYEFAVRFHIVPVELSCDVLLGDFKCWGEEDLLDPSYHLQLQPVQFRLSWDLVRMRRKKGRSRDSKLLSNNTIHSSPIEKIPIYKLTTNMVATLKSFQDSCSSDRKDQPRIDKHAALEASDSSENEAKKARDNSNHSESDLEDFVSAWGESQRASSGQENETPCREIEKPQFGKLQTSRVIINGEFENNDDEISDFEIKASRMEERLNERVRDLASQINPPKHGDTSEDSNQMPFALSRYLEAANEPSLKGTEDINEATSSVAMDAFPSFQNLMPVHSTAEEIEAARARDSYWTWREDLKMYYHLDSDTGSDVWYKP